MFPGPKPEGGVTGTMHAFTEEARRLESPLYDVEVSYCVAQIRQSKQQVLRTVQARDRFSYFMMRSGLRLFLERFVCTQVLERWYVHTFWKDGLYRLVEYSVYHHRL